MRFSLIFSSVIFILLSTQQLHAFVRPTLKKVIDCSPRKTQTEDHEAVVHDISVRGEEDRYATNDYKATFTLTCKGKGRSKYDYDVGTINLVEGGHLVGIRHSIVSSEACTTDKDISNCFITHKEKPLKIKWKGNPLADCRAEGGDGLLVGTIEENVDVTPYKIRCTDQFEVSDLKNLKVVGAYGTNFMKSFKQGSERLVGEGKAYEKDPSKRLMSYENDTGKGTSGGALIGGFSDGEYFLGSHAGDQFDGHQKAQASKGDPDGMEADISNNYGYGYLLKNFPGCSKNDGSI